MNKKQKDQGKKSKKPDELKKYYMLGLPLLGLMGLIALAGLVLTVVLRYFFKLGC